MEADKKRYYDAVHAMQSGVATLMSLGETTGTDVKHLRVGVNMAMSDAGAITRLLVSKGVITEAELWKALADGAEEERDGYRVQIAKLLGKRPEDVTLI